MNSCCVIIPTRNAAKYMPRLIAGLRAQRLPAAQILIMDSSSPDQTAGLARRLGCEAVTIPLEEFRHGATRNLGALRAAADVLVFMTQDALPANECFLEELIAPITSKRAVATYARQLPRPEAGPLERFDRAFHYPAAVSPARNEIRQFYFSDAASAVSRTAFFAVGGFPPDIPSAEDRLLSKKLQNMGYSVCYAPDAQVVHSHALSCLAQMRRYFDFGAASKIAAEQNGARGLRGEGMHYCLAMLRHLDFYLLPVAAFEIGAKALGYWLGLHFELLPPRWRVGLGTSPWWRRPVPHWSPDDPRIVEARAKAARAVAGWI